MQGKVTEVLFAQGVLAFCKVRERERERERHTQKQTQTEIKVIAEEAEGVAASAAIGTAAATGASAGLPEAARKCKTEEQLLEEAQQVFPTPKP